MRVFRNSEWKIVNKIPFWRELLLCSLCHFRTSWRAVSEERCVMVAWISMCLIKTYLTVYLCYNKLFFLIFFFRSQSLRRCTGCMVVWYCGKTCQKQSWIEHKAECKSLAAVKPNIPPDSVRLIARIILKLQVYLIDLQEHFRSKYYVYFYCIFSEVVTLSKSKLHQQDQENLRTSCLVKSLYFNYYRQRIIHYLVQFQIIKM